MRALGMSLSTCLLAARGVSKGRAKTLSTPWIRPATLRPVAVMHDMHMKRPGLASFMERARSSTALTSPTEAA